MGEDYIQIFVSGTDGNRKTSMTITTGNSDISNHGTYRTNMQTSEVILRKNCYELNECLRE
jgi:hypothetical protein